MHQFDRFIYVVGCRLPPAKDYTSCLQDATTVELVLLACQLKIIKSIAVTEP